MTPNFASRLAITACVVVFVSMFFFHLGRMTNSTLEVKETCQQLSFAIPFKGTLP